MKDSVCVGEGLRTRVLHWGVRRTRSSFAKSKLEYLRGGNFSLDERSFMSGVKANVLFNAV